MQHCNASNAHREGDGGKRATFGSKTPSSDSEFVTSFSRDALCHRYINCACRIIVSIPNNLVAVCDLHNHPHDAGCMFPPFEHVSNKPDSIPTGVTLWQTAICNGMLGQIIDKVYRFAPKSIENSELHPPPTPVHVYHGIYVR
ncbi:aspartate aminotransferase [Anopheles sinensis]|uniref:Aspartate aminotransferase n=1 Tax=Anopheles sinensis TaxID=74873 RepID=A0A084VWS1_ANOSI|nr:aspartate aminotransferase [Anopheles sinensis]